LVNIKINKQVTEVCTVAANISTWLWKFFSLTHRMRIRLYALRTKHQMTTWFISHSRIVIYQSAACLILPLWHLEFG